MKITRIEIIPLVRKLEEPFEGGTYRILNRYTIVTRVYTDVGIVGEVFGGDEDQRQDLVVKVVRDHFERLLVGEDARNTERIWNKMFNYFVDLGNRSIHTLDLNNHAIKMQAIACVDMAIWDALGKYYNVPTYKLLGGCYDRVPIIAIGGYYQEGKGSADIQEEIRYYKSLQLSGVKFKVGRVSVDEDVERVRLAREAVGKDFVIVVDANQGWTPEQAIEFAKKSAPLNVRWLEEPTRWYDQYESLRLVRERGGVDVTAGQGEITRYGCRDLITFGRVNILNVDVTIAGGVTEWMKIAHMADHFHVKMAHHEEAQVALHCLAAIPHSLYVEIFPNPKRDPMWFELPIQQPRIRDGYMEIPDKPGFGIDLNKDIIEQYRAS
jgi:L-alanine-DL-glutamate epimerase-like enolase superfamily enzyme